MPSSSRTNLIPWRKYFARLSANTRTNLPLEQESSFLKKMKCNLMGKSSKRYIFLFLLISTLNDSNKQHVLYQFLLGGFQWRSYTQMNDEAENFGRGLRELGLKPFENVVIFAETRAEWLISANGCMKQNMPIVTLYASLGDDALIHGINETDVSCVVTSQQLLEKFKNILPSTKNVNLLVLIEY